MKRQEARELEAQLRAARLSLVSVSHFATLRASSSLVCSLFTGGVEWG